MHDQDKGYTVPLGPRLMRLVVASELEGNQVTVSLKTTHVDVDGGRGFGLLVLSDPFPVAFGYPT